MRSPLRLVVLGAGSWTCVNHLPELEKNPDVSFVAAMDQSADRRANVGARFPFRLVTDSLEEALAQEPDIVVVGSTPDAHFELVGAALRAGAHVLSEKPFCNRAQDAWELVSLAREKQLHLLTAFGWNYQSISSDARDLLAKHGIGNLEHAQIHMATALREMYQEVMPVWGRPDEFLPVPGSYTRLAKGAGYAQAQLSHALGLAMWLMPMTGERVHAFMGHPAAEVDLFDAISFTTKEGATVSLSGACHPMGARNNKHQMEIRFFGSEGQLILDLERELVWLYRDDEHDYVIPQADDAGAYTGHGPATALVDLAMGNPGAENRTPGSLAAAVGNIIEGAYASAMSGSVVNLPLAAAEPATTGRLP